MDDRKLYHTPAANVSLWNRTLCSVLEEMRVAYKTRNFAGLPGLIEEAQTYGNRMEAKLSDVRDYESIKKRHKELKAEIATMKKELGQKNDSSDILDALR